MRPPVWFRSIFLKTLRDYRVAILGWGVGMGLVILSPMASVSTLINTPQTVSIALGALLVSVVDYRLLVVVMGVVVAACGAYLLTREPEPVAEKDPVFA